MYPETRHNRQSTTTRNPMPKSETVPPLSEGSGQCAIYRHMSITDSMHFSGVVGMDENVEWGRCASAKKEREVISILSLAELAGMSTGLVTTTRITHASPASAYAHSVDRRWESDADKKAKAYDDATSCKDIGKI